MKLVITESTNRPPETPHTPDDFRMWWVGDADEPDGDDNPQAVGRIWSPMPGSSETKHHFRPYEGATDFTVDTCYQLITILCQLDTARIHYIATKPQ